VRPASDIVRFEHVRIQVRTDFAGDLDRKILSVHSLAVGQYPVFELSANVPRERSEQLGSKRKFWFRHQDGELWLFKYARPNTGEHWAEKVAAELAAFLGIPHAVVELARVEGMWGAITRDFTRGGASDLVHGNELLLEIDPAYPAAETYRVRAHTLDAVQAVLDQKFIGVRALLD
jgi:hypothetical protein